MLELNERNRVYGEEIHLKIESRNTNYKDWLNDKIKYADLQENRDFFAIRLKSTGGRPKTQFEFTIDAAKLICLLEKNKTSKEIYRWLCSLNNTECIVIHKTRKELLFEININEILEGITKIIPQYKLLDYRIDFYLPDLKIAIEYDETHHSSKHISDNKRQKEIQEILKCDFIRVSEYCEQKAINKLLKLILHKSLQEYEYNNYLSDYGKQLIDSLNMKSYEEIENEKFIEILNSKIEQKEVEQVFKAIDN
jgi:phage anti-repressor protein/very-short-patch-repair endonuclease